MSGRNPANGRKAVDSCMTRLGILGVVVATLVGLFGRGVRK